MAKDNGLEKNPQQLETETDSLFEKAHSRSGDEILAAAQSSLAGLSADEVAGRLSKYGPNRLPEAKSRGPLLRFLLQFHNVLIYVLIVACVLTALLEHWVDASVILGVVFLNAVIGFVQEGKAENALRAIRQMLSPNAMVMRDGRQKTIRLKIWCREILSCCNQETRCLQICV